MKERPNARKYPHPRKGDHYGKLTVISTVNYMNGRPHFLCRCICGTEKQIALPSLRRHLSTSCGCLRAQMLSERRHKHGASETALYNVWCTMKSRCSLPTQKSYKDYGAKGITVCPQWQHDFAAFQTWALGAGYQPGLVIDRKDNNDGYSPHNCRWVTHGRSNRNYSRNRIVEAFGEHKCIADWADDPRCPVSQTTLYQRLTKLKLTPEDAITRPLHFKNFT